MKGKWRGKEHEERKGDSRKEGGTSEMHPEMREAGRGEQSREMG